MGFLDGLFGSKIDPDKRARILDYLVSEGRLRAIQDDAASAYNAVAAKHGGSVMTDPSAARELATAAASMAETYKQLVGQHSALEPIPDEAGETYFGWHSVFLALTTWAEHNASMFGALSELEVEPGSAVAAERVVSVAGPRSVALLEEEQALRDQTLKVETRLMKRCRITAEEGRQIMVDTEREPSE